MSTLERDFQQHLVAALNAPGRATRVWRQNAGKLRVKDERGERWVEGAPKGAGDLVGVVRPEGTHIEIEVKGARTPHTTEQKRWGEMIARLGGIYVVVRYDELKPLSENVLDAVAQIDGDIDARRAREATPA